MLRAGKADQAVGYIGGLYEHSSVPKEHSTSKDQGKSYRFQFCEPHGCKESYCEHYGRPAKEPWA